MQQPLEIDSYGIRLVRLTEDKIELVRRWRNAPKIAQYMDFRGYITEEMQKTWFKKIGNDHNFYFIIKVGKKEVGLVDIKDIDYERGVGESGIFLWDDSFYGKQISYRSLLMLHDFAFQQLHLKSLISHILDDNIRSQRSYLSLGFELDSNQEDKRLQCYTLTAERYASAKKSVISKLRELVVVIGLIISKVAMLEKLIYVIGGGRKEKSISPYYTQAC